MALNLSEKDLVDALQKIHCGQDDAALLMQSNPHILKTIEILGFMDDEQRLTPSGRAFIASGKQRRN